MIVCMHVYIAYTKAINHALKELTSMSKTESDCCFLKQLSTNPLLRCKKYLQWMQVLHIHNYMYYLQASVHLYSIVIVLLPYSTIQLPSSSPSHLPSPGNPPQHARPAVTQIRIYTDCHEHSLSGSTDICRWGYGGGVVLWRFI